MAVYSVIFSMALLAGASATDAVPEGDVGQMWRRFQKDFNRSYDAQEETRRFQYFKENVARAQVLNTEHGFICDDLFDDEACGFGITKFAADSEEEFRANHLGYRPSGEEHGAKVLQLEDVNDGVGVTSIDWRSKGAVTAVKDQGECGSCWAFSATEEIESSVFMATQKLPTLSTQQIISCDKKDLGCNGGDTPTAYKYVEKAGGLDSAADYPDKSHKTGNTGRCTWDKKSTVKVNGFSYATPPCKRGQCKHQDEDTLAAALASKGPISICVNAGSWQTYKRGILSKKCSGANKKLDHCVQLVGFDKTGQTPYWIVRNSWNTDWGEKGYIRLEIGQNACGVADEATIVDATMSTDGHVDESIDLVI